MTRNIGKQVGVEEKQVTIRMLSVDGRNMTKSFFFQLPQAEDRDFSDIWGYVINDRDYYTVGVINGNLYRCKVISASIEDSIGRSVGENTYKDRVKKVTSVLKQLFIGA